jgi:oligopeptide transport system substrate-binding protein
MKKALLTSILAAGLLLSACSTYQTDNSSGTESTQSNSAESSAANTDAASAETNNPKEITLVLSQELNTIDPKSGVDSNSSSAMNNIYEGLYRLDEGARPYPAGAAELPQISADGLVYTIKLNQAAQWSNGAKITADDYVYGWSRAVSAENAAENLHFYTYLKNADEIISGEKNISELGIRALDDYTLEITLKAPISYFTSLLVSPPFFPLNREYVEDQGNLYASDSDHSIYNGPFVLTEFSGPGIGADWAYLKNDSYWDKDNVHIDRINIKIIKETATAMSLFGTGEVDQIGISGEYAQNEINSPAFVAANASTLVFIGYNAENEIFKNKNAREAISLLIDREAVANSLLGDGSAPANGITPYSIHANPTTGQDFAETLGVELKTDVARAKELWAAARSELGLTGEVTIEFPTFESDRMKTVGAYIQGVVEENLEGVKVNLNVLPVSVFIDTARNGNFTMFMCTWSPDFSDATSLLELFETDGGSNWSRYSNPQYDTLLKSANVDFAADAEKRFEKLQEAERFILDDFGVAPIFYQSSALLRNPKLKGIIYHTTYPIYDYKNAYLED